MRVRRHLLLLALLLWASSAHAQVAIDALSESHTGTTGSASEASFGWTHTPVGTPAGVVVCTFVNSSADDATAVSYGASSMAAVTGGRAVSTGSEPGDAKVWLLGSSVPTGAQTVTVTRTNNATVMYALAWTVTAGGDTDVYEAGIVLLQEVGTVAEQSVDDGSPGTNSLRGACGNSGRTGLVEGASSTLVHNIEFGARTDSGVYETTAGQGSRLIGWDAASDDRALVHFAVRQAAGGGGSTACRNLLLLGVGGACN